MVSYEMRFAHLTGSGLASAILAENGTVYAGRNVVKPGVAYTVPHASVLSLCKRGLASGPFYDAEERTYAKPARAKGGQHALARGYADRRQP